MERYNPLDKAKRERARENQQKLAAVRERNMIVKQMSDRMGRDFVRMVLTKLKYDVPYLSNSADAYRHLAKQEAAIAIKKMIYKHCPDQWEIMMREDLQDG